MKIWLFVLFLSNVSGASADCAEESRLFIAAPKTMSALKGSCLQIPCSFTVGEGAEWTVGEPTGGVWIRNDERFAKYPSNVIFNSSLTATNYPMSFTGSLSQTDCGTLFSDLLANYTDRYFFRMESGLFRATAICDPIWIEVEDSPPRPKITISGDQREQETISVSCSAPTPCPLRPPRLTWSLQPDAGGHTEENPDRTLTTKVQTSVTLSDADHGRNISCRASYPVDGGRQKKAAVAQVVLSVSYAPKDTTASVSPPGVVSAGSRVNLSCSSRANPPISSFSWFRISEGGAASRVSDGHFHSFNATNATVGGAYYCVAVNAVGNQTSQKVFLTLEGEDSSSSFQWETVLGVLIGVLGLVCLIVYVWWLKSMCRKNQQQPQSQTGEEMITEEPSRKAEEMEETIHYGDIDFSRLTPAAVAGSQQDAGQTQGTLYAEVKVNRPEAGGANGNPQAAGGPEQIYAEVR